MQRGAGAYIAGALPVAQPVRDARLHLFLARPGRSVVANGDQAISGAHLALGQEGLQFDQDGQERRLVVLAASVLDRLTGLRMIEELLFVQPDDCLTSKSGEAGDHAGDQHLHRSAGPNEFPFVL